MIYSKLFSCDRIGIDRLEAAKKACDEWMQKAEGIYANFILISVSHSMSLFGIATILVYFETTTIATEASLATEFVGVNQRLKGAHFMD